MLKNYDEDKLLFFAMLDDWIEEHGLAGIFRAFSEWLQTV